MRLSLLVGTLVIQKPSLATRIINSSEKYDKQLEELVGLGFEMPLKQTKLTESIESRIIGGVEAAVNEYPWYAKLFTKVGTGDEATWEDKGCGGSLITAEYVLTAAHCVDYFLSSTQPGVEIGAFKKPFREGDNGGQYRQFRQVKEVFIHPLFNKYSFDNDFALLHLSNKSGIKPVKLDKDGVSATFKTGKDVLWTAGFGRNADGATPNTLQEVDVGYVKPSDCIRPVSSYLPSEVTTNMMCAATIGKDSCQGDSGGPLIDKLSGLLVGVVSWGRGCATKGYPGVYSRISTQFDWIQDTVCRNSDFPLNDDFCTRPCTVEELFNKTHVLPFRTFCYMIETFDGGEFKVGTTKNSCTPEEHRMRKKFSELAAASNSTLYYKKYKDRRNMWSGAVTIQQKVGSAVPELREMSREIDRDVETKTIEKSFDAEILLPSCDYGCPTTNEKMVQIEIVEDFYPSETSWYVTNDCTGEIVKAGLAHGDTVCIDENQKYSFTIEDSQGDGICCRWGEGSYSVTYDDVLIKEGGNFDSSETTVFGGTCS